MTEREKIMEVVKVAKQRFQHTWEGAPYAAPMSREQSLALINAAEAHAESLPKTKMAEVWRVEYAWSHAGGFIPVIAQYSSHQLARNHAENLGNGAACIRVTGPHQQEIPA